MSIQPRRDVSKATATARESPSGWQCIEFAPTLPCKLDLELKVADQSDFEWRSPAEVPCSRLEIGRLETAVIPIRIKQKQPRVISVEFDDQTSSFMAAAGEQHESAGGDTSTKCETSELSRKSGRSGKTKGRSTKRTRIKPPADLVKLEDRLYYLLQPPLESLFASAELRFPFPPFPYQYEGIAFLFPRESAILADEMGLGKTMQAITAIRMLLLAQQARKILLICPKPLVTNWQREFQLWAPEIPVTVVEGDVARRRFIWQQNAPVRIANYELLMRDRDILDDPELHFDLVVLDEVQRIKNRNSTTAEIARGLPRSRSWALTGTPIENSVDDLVNIFEFLSPGHLRNEMNIRTISKETRDHILRRTKDKVLTEMPPKMFRDEQLELTAARK